MVIGRSDEQQSPSDSTALRRREIVWRCSAESIWASGHVPCKQAGHMIAVAPKSETFLMADLAPKGPFSNRISYVNWFILLCVAEPGSRFSPQSAFAAATSGPKHGHCDVHNGLTCTHAAQRPPSQSARTFAPEGNSHPR